MVFSVKASSLYLLTDFICKCIYVQKESTMCGISVEAKWMCCPQQLQQQEHQKSQTYKQPTSNKSVSRDQQQNHKYTKQTNQTNKMQFTKHKNIYSKQRKLHDRNGRTWNIPVNKQLGYIQNMWAQVGRVNSTEPVVFKFIYSFQWPATAMLHNNFDLPCEK